MIYLSQKGGNVLKSRIKQIRKENELTQVEFGERIGVKGNTITNYENGLRNPTDAVVLAICREFDVNEEWLRYGKEPKEKTINPDDRYSHNLAKLANMDDETIMNWVNMIAETNPAMLKEIEGFMKKLLGIEG